MSESVLDDNYFLRKADTLYIMNKFYEFPMIVSDDISTMYNQLMPSQLKKTEVRLMPLEIISIFHQFHKDSKILGYELVVINKDYQIYRIVFGFDKQIFVGFMEISEFNRLKRVYELLLEIDIVKSYMEKTERLNKYIDEEASNVHYINLRRVEEELEAVRKEKEELENENARLTEELNTTKNSLTSITAQYNLLLEETNSN